MTHFYTRDKSASNLLRISRPVISHSRSSSTFSHSTLDTDSDLAAAGPRNRGRTANSLLRCAAETQVFLRFGYKHGEVTEVKCCLADNLMQMTIEKSNSVKTFHTLELKIISDLSMEMKRILRTSGFARKVYGFRLQTKRKVYELASEHVELRDDWTNMLKIVISSYSDFRQNNALWKYVQLQCKLKDAEQRVGVNRFKVQSLEVVIQNLEKGMQVANRDVVEMAVNEIITKIEQETTKKLTDFPAKCQSNSGCVHIATKKNDVTLHTAAIEKQSTETQAWKLILPILSFDDISRVTRVSCKLHRMCKNRLQSQSFWSVLSAGGLEPRSSSWVVYCTEFCKHPGFAREGVVSVDVLSDIKRDLMRSTPQHSEKVERILVNLCKMHEDVGYCQGMHLITEFLLTTLESEQRAFFVLAKLMNSPYCLAEVWKPGLPRVKLVAYQLEELLKLKLPTLADHFQALDLPLEVLVAPWILTLFTQLVRSTQTKIPLDILVRIWDLFLVRGWAAIHAVSLSILHLSEGKTHVRTSAGGVVGSRDGVFSQRFRRGFLTNLRRLQYVRTGCRTVERLRAQVPTQEAEEGKAVAAVI